MMGGFNHHYYALLNKAAQISRTAATKKPASKPPTAANDYRTRTYDFAHAMRRPEDRLVEADDRHPYWCK
jgi:hypothetical protein